MVVLVGMCCCMGWLIGGFDYFVQSIVDIFGICKGIWCEWFDYGLDFFVMVDLFVMCGWILVVQVEVVCVIGWWELCIVFECVNVLFVVDGKVIFWIVGCYSGDDVVFEVMI